MVLKRVIGAIILIVLLSIVGYVAATVHLEPCLKSDCWQRLKDNV